MGSLGTASRESPHTAVKSQCTQKEKGKNLKKPKPLPHPPQNIYPQEDAILVDHSCHTSHPHYPFIYGQDRIPCQDTGLAIGTE